MFKAMYGFFQMIFLLILFKMFAPELFTLSVQLLTNFLIYLNDAITQTQSAGTLIGS